MPKGFLTEDGCRPEFATFYGAREMPTADYPLRTWQNARDSRSLEPLSRHLGTISHASHPTASGSHRMQAMRAPGKGRRTWLMPCVS
jgi:Circularly permutated YpsA SLOG family